MPSTARQLRQPPTIEAIGRVPYFANIVGLYKILNKEGNLYKVKLLDLIKVYPIFLLDKLRKAINNLLPRQKNKPPLLI